jgi:hypothetical protein
MSDNWLQFVPSDPTYRPSLAAAERAKALLSSFAPRADEINVKFNDTIRFIHPGANWSGVNCPVCGANAEAWWTEAMNSAFTNGFSDLDVTARCCGARVSLNDLNYVWPAAFASFVIEVMNPNIKNLTPAQEQELASCLGCKLRRIWVHI